MAEVHIRGRFKYARDCHLFKSVKIWQQCDEGKLNPFYQTNFEVNKTKNLQQNRRKNQMKTVAKLF